jgi:hypothetical protein
MDKLINRRELHKRIVAVPKPVTDGYIVKHDIPGEAIVCEVPTLEIAGCIVAALRDRQLSKLALHLLAKKHVKKRR